jgi:hypothetical protein
VVYDEGHQFDSGSRGITYELLLTEIKGLLPQTAQTVLISAVIPNAQEIGNWLVGDKVQVVRGTGLLPTVRSVAFASWIERLGQLMFFESDTFTQPDYFVPRVIEQQTLARHHRERSARYFPDRDRPNDIALYLGIRLSSQGPVAIFCGRKDSASSIAGRAVDIFERGLPLAAPATSADPDELRRLKNLVDGHFGDGSVASRAAAAGIFVHHGATPHGIRLAIEHAMQVGLIRFVVCTSTLAQGVNLPIRYLIVSGIHQAGEKIKVRDFQNLIGRAGRSGMHTEGLVIFSDPRVYDTRKTESWRFASSVELLSADRTESSSSSLLELLLPLKSSDGRGELRLPAADLCALLLSDQEQWPSWAVGVVNSNRQFKFEAKALVAELQRRRRLVGAIESYLMANRGVSSFEEFEIAAKKLAAATLAHHLAPDDAKPGVGTLFSCVAEYVHREQPEVEKQAIYARTLLGVRSAKAVESWVLERHDTLLSLKSNEDWLEMLWPLFSAHVDDKFFHSVAPVSLPLELARLWVQGASYQMLFERTKTEKGTKPWGQSRARPLTDDDIVDFCESTLGFECSLVLAGVAHFLFGQTGVHEEPAAAINLFQKAFKYGLPDWLAISCYEHGFADRVIAQRLCEAARGDGFSGKFFAPAMESHRERIEEALANYPSYFKTVLASRGK